MNLSALLGLLCISIVLVACNWGGWTPSQLPIISTSATLVTVEERVEALVVVRISPGNNIQRTMPAELLFDCTHNNLIEYEKVTSRKLDRMHAEEVFIVQLSWHAEINNGLLMEVRSPHIGNVNVTYVTKQGDTVTVSRPVMVEAYNSIKELY